MNKFSFICLISIFSLCLFACSPSLTVNISSVEEVAVEFSSGMGDTIKETMYSVTGTDGQSPLFNKNAVSKNFEVSGFPLESVEVDDNNLWVKTKATSFEEVEKFASGLIENLTSTSVTMSLNPKKIQNMIEILPEETVGFLDLLCAPIFTMEELTSEEYYEVLSAIYGKTLAEEALNSNFTIEFSVPKNKVIKTIDVKIPYSKTVKNQNKARITIPLTEFLCNLGESKISISW